MTKNKSNPHWIKEHLADPFVKQAQAEGFRSRAVYKLLEIQQRNRLFKPGMTVIDLGSAPGSWSQLVVKLIKPQGKVFALDILPMEPIPGVTFIQGDFTEQSVIDDLFNQLAGVRVDWVISDMAPNMSGNKSIDMPRAIYLGELALDLCDKTLSLGGGFLIKMFQGVGFEAFLAEVKQKFKKVSIKKPKASREKSREVYILAEGLKEKKL